MGGGNAETVLPLPHRKGREAGSVLHEVPPAALQHKGLGQRQRGKAVGFQIIRRRSDGMIGRMSAGEPAEQLRIVIRHGSVLLYKKHQRG